MLNDQAGACNAADQTARISKKKARKSGSFFYTVNTAKIFLINPPKVNIFDYTNVVSDYNNVFKIYPVIITGQNVQPYSDNNLRKDYYEKALASWFRAFAGFPGIRAGNDCNDLTLD
jgi:hypothetical protein